MSKSQKVGMMMIISTCAYLSKLNVGPLVK